MGKKNRIKKEKAALQTGTLAAAKKPPLMDPVLIKAYTSGRSVGEKEGRVNGAADMMMLFNKWIQEIDQHVKGIGPKKKLEIEKYLGDRIKETIEAQIEED